MARPKINFFPDEDKKWGGYKDAVQCLYCRRWMVPDFQDSFVSKSGKFHHIVLFKELRYERSCWYISNRSHNPNMCRLAKESREWARSQGYKSYGQWKRILKIEQEMAQEAANASQP